MYGKTYFKAEIHKYLSCIKLYFYNMQVTLIYKLGIYL